MKTAMQELKENIIALINASKNTGSNRDNSDYRIGLHQALGLIDLEAEKEQITTAYAHGMAEGITFEITNSLTAKTPEQYYNLTFKSDE